MQGALGQRFGSAGGCRRVWSPLRGGDGEPLPSGLL